MRVYVRAFVPVLQPWPFDIFSDFLHEVVSPYDLDDPQKFFGSKIFLTPKMAKIWPFLAKIDSFESFLHVTSKRRYESS